MVIGVDYANERGLCKRFLEQYSENGRVHYIEKIEHLSADSETLFEIRLDDLQKFSNDDEFTQFTRNIKKNTLRYVGIFSETIDELIREHQVVFTQNEQMPSCVNGVSLAGPTALTRTFRVAFVSEANEPLMRLREIRSAHIGTLVKFKGICTRVSDVKPLMEVACFTCEICDSVTYQEVSGEHFAPLIKCTSGSCRGGPSAAYLMPETRNSKFVGFQEAKIQELSEDVPVGHTPRSVTVHLKGHLTRGLGPGETVDVHGIYLPAGFKPMQNNLLASTFIDVTAIRKHKSNTINSEIEGDVLQKIEKYREDQNLYSRLAESIAPEIFGHTDVKKALLLLLSSGVSRNLQDGVSVRGDIHICLMGDPGVAKSQLLKHMVQLAPRAVYTTGRGSSGVGLTAAIQKDAVTGEMILEGGALVLADKGICCIDEFDKMDESDRTAIHEVMEQQTVSIAKAGITTTLNARTAVLAAANPAFGRYRMSATPQENINLPAALLSRFDLLWLIVDTADIENDIALAHHVLHVHKCGQAPGVDSSNLMSMDELRTYVYLCKNFHPYMPEELTEYVASAYAEMRFAECNAAEHATGYTTARTLLSILRLSQALARLGWSEKVTERDVDEALRLMKMSKMSLAASNIQVEEDVITCIFKIIRAWVDSQSTSVVAWEDVQALVSKNGFASEALDACVREYEALGIWMKDDKKNITFVQ